MIKEFFSYFLSFVVLTVVIGCEYTKAIASTYDEHSKWLQGCWEGYDSSSGDNPPWRMELWNRYADKHGLEHIDFLEAAVLSEQDVCRVILMSKAKLNASPMPEWHSNGKTRSER